MSKEKTKAELMKEIAGLEKATGELSTECGRTKETLIRVHNENVQLHSENAKLDNQAAQNARLAGTLKEVTKRSINDELCELLHMMDLTREKAKRIALMNHVLEQH